MDLFKKFVIYILIIASEIDYLLSRPIPILLSLNRLPRQVVQPKWLSNPDFLFINPNVRVTEQNLKEAAAIREAIQRAINSGSFVVNVGQTDSPIPTIEMSDSDSNIPQPPSPPAPPMFPSFDFPRFNFSQFDFSDFNFEFFNAEQRAAFGRELFRFWDQFVENSRSIFNTRS